MIIYRFLAYTVMSLHMHFFFPNLLSHLSALEQVVNLIPFNPIGTLSQFNTSSEEKVCSFQKILRGTYNIRTTVRKQMGQDIMGACGQLVVNQSDTRSVENTGRMTDIEDFGL